jgi:outer membrane protein TolC
VKYELARWQVAQRVKLAYLGARGSQEIRDVLKTTVDNFQKIVDYHSTELSAGAIAEQDLLRVRLESERLKISTDLAVIEANRTRIELLKEMGALNIGFRTGCPPGSRRIRVAGR